MADDGATDLTFPNVLAMVEYLKAGGWKIAKSLAYKHRNQGRIRPQQDGLFHNKDVQRYARAFLRRADTGKTVLDDSDAHQKEKQAAETEKLKAQARHWGMKAGILEGLYVEKDAFKLELARRLAVLKNDVWTSIYSGAPGIINVVDGNTKKVPDLIEHMLIWGMGWLRRYGEIDGFHLPDPLPAAGMNDDSDRVDDETDNEGED